MTMKERIARAIYPKAVSLYDFNDTGMGSFEEEDYLRDECYAMAQAALEAMIRLPDNLVRVGGMEIDELWSDDCDNEEILFARAWQAAIKAAIAER